MKLRTLCIALPTLAVSLTACDNASDLLKERMPSEAASEMASEAESDTEEELMSENMTEEETSVEAVMSEMEKPASLPDDEAESESDTVVPDDSVFPAGWVLPAPLAHPEEAINASTLSIRGTLPMPFPEELLPQPSHAMETLQWELAGQVAEYEGDWSVYAQNLMTGEELIVNDVSMPSASLMKLFVMGTVYQAIEDGTLERTSEVMSLMSSMITVSSNGDTNRLLAKLGDGSYAAGIEKVNAYISSHGYSEGTHEYNGFQDAATVVDPAHHNSVTARDCGMLLERVYHRSFGSRRVCNEIEDWMLRQETRYKIPKGIGADVQIGNKTGETDDTENDAAIVYANECDFILVVLSHGWPGKDGAQKHIQEIARKCYVFLTGQEEEVPFIPVPAGIWLLS